MSITAKELAKILGLSPAAVSMALNQKPGVSAKTREKVISTAKQYGYDFSKREYPSLTSSASTKGALLLLVYRKAALLSPTVRFLMKFLRESMKNAASCTIR